MNEKEFLITLAVSRFNEQYSQNLPFDSFDVFSITPNVNSTLGYEFLTRTFDDNIRLRLYLNFTDKNYIPDYVLEVDGSDYVRQLGDEVYVSNGTLHRHYFDDGVYKFDPLFEDVELLDIYLTRDNEAYIARNGEYFITS